MLKRVLFAGLMMVPLCVIGACGAPVEDVTELAEGSLKKSPPKTPEGCKAFEDDLGKGCANPEWTDRDGDGCLDLYVCHDEPTDSSSDPDAPKDPVPPAKDSKECKPMDKDLGMGCANPEWTDRDGDGCVDLYVCHDGEDASPDEPLPPECQKREDAINACSNACEAAASDRSEACGKGPGNDACIMENDKLYTSCLGTCWEQNLNEFCNAWPYPVEKATK